MTARWLLLAGVLAACADDPARPDRSSPAIESIAPAVNATGVSLRAPVTIVFSEAVSIEDSLRFVRLVRAGADVGGSIIRSDREHIQLVPAELLQPGERYDVVINGAVTDAAGNRVVISTTSTFTTLGRKIESVDANAMMTHLSRLAHDSMAGRGSGTADELRAAQYIAQELQRAGIQAPPGNYLMQFAIPPFRVGGRTDVTSQNVIGVIPGNGALQNEWVVLGAHYDHVGIRTVSGVPQVFNGADDNGSGTAVLLQLATQLAAYIQSNGLGGEPRRSIMIQAYGAEELGLIGSEAYCSNPKYPLATVKAMINFDMVGRLRNGALKVGGASTAPEWRVLLQRYNLDNLGIVESDCSACTDYACFRRNQRPVLWFFTDTHPQYHQPGDDLSLINTEGITQIANLALRITLDLVLRPRALAFTQ